jgi:hypothetical protein
MRFQDYSDRMADLMEALGMGTSRDIAKYTTDVGAETSRPNAASAAWAAAAGQAAELEYRRQALQQQGAEPANTGPPARAVHG